jgi:hypothetical protein
MDAVKTSPLEYFAQEEKAQQRYLWNSSWPAKGHW